ncbi:MAG: F0F1 ATP synthase subunit A [Bacteroidota bacterium]|nr:F0F1 ATP synthase subunit A [Bacteroidota bacterium]
MQCKKLKISVFFVLLLFLSNSLLASEHQHENSKSEEKESFNVVNFIFSHIKDAHSWHLWDYTDDEGEEHHVSIPLPVILFHDGQLTAFLSSDFDHGHAVVSKNGYHYVLQNEMVYLTGEDGALHKEENENGKSVINNKTPLDFSITKTAAAIILSAIILLLMFISLGNAYKKRTGKPKGFQAFMEPLILFVTEDMVRPNIKENPEKYMPYILTVFFFILINNVLGIIPFFPGGANVTGNISVTMTLAVFTMIMINFNGSKDYWKHIFATPGVPVYLLPIMLPVELIGILTKPFALMIRLFANITAGHTIILSLVSIIFIFKSLSMSFISVPFVLFMDLLELLVAVIQAYIFAMLSALFIGLSTEKSH